jgi:hypothetical protein
MNDTEDVVQQEKTPLHILRRNAEKAQTFETYGWVKAATPPKFISDLDRIEGSYGWDWLSE